MLFESPTFRVVCNIKNFDILQSRHFIHNDSINLSLMITCFITSHARAPIDLLFPTFWAISSCQSTQCKWQFWSNYLFRISSYILSKFWQYIIGHILAFILYVAHSLQCKHLCRLRTFLVAWQGRKWRFKLPIVSCVKMPPHASLPLHKETIGPP